MREARTIHLSFSTDIRISGLLSTKQRNKVNK